MDVFIRLSSPVAGFYSRIAAASGLPLEQVLSDTLFRLAGELSLQTLQAHSVPPKQEPPHEP